MSGQRSPLRENAFLQKAAAQLSAELRAAPDTAKALALGARACLAGRPLIYGLAVAGRPGVSRAIDPLRNELDLTLALLGCLSPDGLDRRFVAPAHAPAAWPAEGARLHGTPAATAR